VRGGAGAVVVVRRCRWGCRRRHCRVCGDGRVVWVASQSWEHATRHPAVSGPRCPAFRCRAAENIASWLAYSAFGVDLTSMFEVLGQSARGK